MSEVVGALSSRQTLSVKRFFFFPCAQNCAYGKNQQLTFFRLPENPKKQPLQGGNLAGVFHSTLAELNRKDLRERLYRTFLERGRENGKTVGLAVYRYQFFNRHGIGFMAGA
ncbi:hypothetical protein [Kingella oralis]